MKAQELKKLIREEIKTALKEETGKPGLDKNFILKSYKGGVGVLLQKLDPYGGRVHSEMLILKNEIPHVIAFLNKHK
jgi:hypothetical protein